MRALSLNIGAAAPPRASTILAWLRRRSEDVLVLTETSRGDGTRLLLDDLEARGYKTFSTVEGRDRGVAVASRIPVHSMLDDRLSLTLPWRVSGVVLDTSPRIALIGVYVPSRDRSPLKIARKEAFIASLLASIRDLSPSLRNHLLLAGDYNTVARHHLPRLPGFFPYEYALHEELEELGLHAAHELRARGSQPHRTGSAVRATATCTTTSTSGRRFTPASSAVITCTVRASDACPTMRRSPCGCASPRQTVIRLPPHGSIARQDGRGA